MRYIFLSPTVMKEYIVRKNKIRNYENTDGKDAPEHEIDTERNAATYLSRRHPQSLKCQSHFLLHCPEANQSRGTSHRHSTSPAWNRFTKGEF